MSMTFTSFPARYGASKLTGRRGRAMPTRASVVSRLLGLKTTDMLVVPAPESITR